VEALHEVDVGVERRQRLGLRLDAFQQHERARLVDQADDLRQQAAGRGVLDGFEGERAVQLHDLRLQ
jgi:hypothetical protein